MIIKSDIDVSSEGHIRFITKLSECLVENKRGTRVNVKLSLCLISYTFFHKYLRGSGGIAPPLFTSALDGGE
jgi:hypothetical protein